MAAPISPTQTVEAMFDALARRDWSALATLVHLSALDALRQQNLGLIILVTEERRAGKVGGGYNPQDVVIADHLPQIGNERVPGFLNNPTIAELASLSSTELFVRWCAAVYRPDPQDPVREVVGLQRRMIGEILESDSLAHVLYRRESRHVEMNELFIDLPGRVMVMPLRKEHERWRLLLNDDLGWSVDFMELVRPSPPFSHSQLKRTTRLAPSAPTPGETRTQPGPVETVHSAFAAFELRDWQRLATLVDSERLASFQREELAYLAAWLNSTEARAQARREGVSIFMLSYDDSLPPEAVAEQSADVKVAAFPNTPTLGELARLSPAAFFGRWCQAVYESDPAKGPGGGRTQMRREVIGDVFEDQTLAHVLYRSDVRRTQPWPVERMLLKRSAPGWRLLLNDDIGWTVDLSMLLNHP